MAYVKNWLHCVWGTKDRLPYLSEKIIHDVISHIKINAKEKGIYLDALNGHKDHLHCLISLNPDQSLSKVMQLIKGEASYWINSNSLTRYRFGWAEEYFLFQQRRAGSAHFLPDHRSSYHFRSAAQLLDPEAGVQPDAGSHDLRRVARPHAIPGDSAEAVWHHDLVT